MTVAATISGAPLATPTQLATQPNLGQAAVTVGARISPQALTANGDAQFRPQQLSAQAPNARQAPVQFPTQGGGGAVAAVPAANGQATVNPNVNAPTTFNFGSPIILNNAGTTNFLAQLFGQSGGVLQGNGLALFSAISGAVQAAAPATEQANSSKTQELQQLRDIRVARGLSLSRDNVAQTTTAAPTAAAVATAKPPPAEPPRPPLPAKRDLARIQQGNKQYRSVQFHTHPFSAPPPPPEGVPRTAVT